jgi:hypothetical protein
MIFPPNFNLEKGRFPNWLYAGALLAGLFGSSCGKEGGAGSPFAGLTRITVAAVPGAAARVEIWHAGPLTDGYAPLVFALQDSSHPGQAITDAHIHLMPMMEMSGGSGMHGAPVENPDEVAVNGQFRGAVVFTMDGSWMLHVQVHNHRVDKEGEVMIPLTVGPSQPSSVHLLTTSNDNSTLAVSWLRRNDATRAGLNDLELTVHRQSDAMTWVPDSSYTIAITPEMPSMGHGSEGNTDPVHAGTGHYLGKVNFPMTGDWRLHIQLKKSGATIAPSFYFDARVN